MRRVREGLLLVRDLGRPEPGFELELCSLDEHRFKIGEKSITFENVHIRKTSPRTMEVGDSSADSKYSLQLSSEKELDSWFNDLRKVAGSTVHSNEKSVVPNHKSVPLLRSKTFTAGPSSKGKKEKRKSVMNEHPAMEIESDPITLVELVRKEHVSNYKCCECDSEESVEWISINLLCVVCIKCSGVHRSLGSHISKIRSLTLDNFKSPEVLHLLRHKVSNSSVNGLYESNLPPDCKITPSVSDAERLKFITEKYRDKIWVDEITADFRVSFRALIKAIHLNSVYMLQRCLAQSKLSFKEIIHEQEASSSEKLQTIFQYSLKHHDMVHGRPVYYISEFLLLNGLPVEEIPADWLNSDLPMHKYWRKRFETYGSYRWTPPTRNESDDKEPTSFSSSPSSNSNSNSNEKNANTKRWSLNSIPMTAQAMKPTNLLSAHRSLRSSRKGHSTGNN